MSRPGTSRESEAPSSSSVFYWPPFWFFMFFVLVVSLFGYAAFQHNWASSREKELRLLSTIADLKLREITQWKLERMGDAETLAQAPFWLREMDNWMRKGHTTGASRLMILERMDLARHAYGYREIYLFDAEAKPLLATSPHAPPPEGSTVSTVREAIEAQEVRFLDIETDNEHIHMGVAAPVVVVRDGKPQAIAAIYLEVDPFRFLFPLLKTVPLANKSMRIDLARRNGEEMLFLAVPAVHENPIVLRQPLAEAKMVAAEAVSGERTQTEGLDYRGVPVFAAFRRIPASRWVLIAKVDQAEVYGPMRQKAKLVAGILGALMLLTGMAVALWWRNQLARFHIAEQKLTEKNLRATSTYVRSLIEASLDPLVTISPEGKITDVNRASEEATGLSREQLIGTDFSDYFTEPDRARAGYQQAFDRGFVHNYPLTISHRSGRLTDVLYSATVYRDEVGNIRGVFAAARDVTERRRAEMALEKRMKELTCLYAISHDMHDVLSVDEICRRAIEHLTSAMQFPEITVPVLDIKGKRYTSKNYTTGLLHHLHAEFKAEGGAFGHLFVYYTEQRPFLIPEEQNLINAVAQAISTWLEHKRVESELIEQEEFFRMIAENVEDFIAVVDLQGRRLYNSPSYARLFGDVEALKGTDSFAEIHPDDRERIKQTFVETILSGIGRPTEFRLVLASGEIRHMESHGGLIKSSQGDPLRVVVISRDVTSRKQAEDKIHQLAFYDALTHLPNRSLLNDRLIHTMAECRRSGRYGALMFLDLDNFKPLNDKYGHNVGDLLLIEVARRTSSCVREVDTVARFGGDEFVVVLSELDASKAESAAEAGRVAEKIRTLLAEPYRLKIRLKGGDETEIEHRCTSSIGVTLFINHEANAEDVVKRADRAMYRAKEAGRNMIRFHDQDVQTETASG